MPRKRPQPARTSPAARDSAHAAAALDWSRSAPATRRESAELRLARIGSACLTGQLASAELELHDWLRERECPAAARILLAALLARDRRYDEALLALPRPAQVGRQDDPRTLQLLLAILESVEQEHAAGRVVHRLRQLTDLHPTLADWLAALDIDRPARSPATAYHQDTLVKELAAQPQVIPSLVVAQRLRPDPDATAALRQAIPHATASLEADHERLAICQAMAELAELAGDADDARDWATRGQQIDPYAASLALLLDRLDKPKPAAATDSQPDPATQSLERAIDAHPGYPDLRLAIIRRHLAAGRTGQARRMLQRWQQDDPDHPLAEPVRKELAA